MEQGEPTNSVKHATCAEDQRTADTWKELKNMNDWTKDHVYQWLINLKVQEKYAQILYDEDVTGASLILFEKQDFLDAGLKHGPAVLIFKNLALFKTPTKSFEHIAEPEHIAISVEVTAEQHLEQEKAAVLCLTTGSAELIPPLLGIDEQGESSVKIWTTEDDRKCQGNSLNDTPSVQDTIYQQQGGARQSHACVESETKEDQKGFLKASSSTVTCFCQPRPFDIRTTNYEYIQNQILPPETGPSNLIDPVHEYKLLANTDGVTEEDILRKITLEVFRFCAACMNSRTNGTIHLGVGDEPLYKHGQIIGIEIMSLNKYINAFYKGLKEHFKGNANIAMLCIRPPIFVRVKCLDKSVKWVVEIDVVPQYRLTLKKLFYTTLDKKGRKSKCLFVRDGANTVNYIPEKSPKTCKQNSQRLNHYLETWVLARQLAEENAALGRQIQLLEAQSQHTNIDVSSRSEDVDQLVHNIHC